MHNIKYPTYQLGRDSINKNLVKVQLKITIALTFFAPIKSKREWPSKNVSFFRTQDGATSWRIIQMTKVFELATGPSWTSVWCRYYIFTFVSRAKIVQSDLIDFWFGVWFIVIHASPVIPVSLPVVIRGVPVSGAMPNC